MPIGVSSSCLYPMPPAESLEILGRLGVGTTEVFINAPSELTVEYAQKLNRIKNEYGMKILSLHPFTSFAETTMLFSEYKQRFFDMLDYYKSAFEVINTLGAEFMVIHGSKLPAKITHEEYFERFALMIEEGKKAGVTVTPENVNKHLSESPEFMREMKAFLGNDFRMVFDVKQANRAGFSPLEFAREFADDIVHIHVSDHNKTADCLPPSKGDFDFAKLFEIMKKSGYGGSYVIELYRHNFGDPSELSEAMRYLEGLYN